MQIPMKSKQLIALFITAFALVLMYLSAYLPYVKGSLYITALQNSQQATTLQDYLKPYEDAFNFWSPVGDPEEIRFFGNNILNLLSNQKQTLSETAATNLVDYAFDKLNSPSLGTKGLNYSQVILEKASILASYGKIYKKPEAFQKAEELYKQGLELSPHRPQFLYGLLSLYLAEGKTVEAKAIGETILKYWPTDQNIAKIMAELK